MNGISNFLLVTLLIVVIEYSSITTAVICPAPESYAPCSCGLDSSVIGIEDTIAIECFDHFLGDARISDILDSFLNTPSVSPVSTVALYRNLLTRVPHQIFNFTQLDSALLDHNSIRTITKNSFNFTRSPRYVWLNNNQMTSMEPDAFQGNFGNHTAIFLFSNQFTRFESDVFMPILEKIANYGGHSEEYVRMDQNPIDCESNHCHMAWLIRDNRNLLPAVYLGQCSNGTAFEDLDPNGYNDCAI